jgi:hypothetical protein
VASEEIAEEVEVALEEIEEEVEMAMREDHKERNHLSILILTSANSTSRTINFT